MTLSRIGLFSVSSRYSVLPLFTSQLAKALESLGNIKTDILDTRTNSQLSFQKMLAFKPQLIIVFNSLFAGVNQQLFCDFLQIPTLFYLVDTPFHFDDPSSPYASVACIDRGQCRYLTLRGFERVLFLPHAVEEPCHNPPDKPRPYGCVMMSSGIDFQSYYYELQTALSSSLLKQIDSAFEMLKADPLITLDEALPLDLPTEIPRKSILKIMDLFWKGKTRVDLLLQLNGIPIDLFGGGDDWRSILKDSCPHVTIHPEGSYSDAVQIMSQAKIVLNECSSVRDGAHERIFNGLSRGAAIATASTPYLREQFQERNGIAFYPSLHDLKEKIHLWLTDEACRCADVEKGQQRIAQAHLWKHRAVQLKAFIEQYSIV